MTQSSPVSPNPRPATASFALDAVETSRSSHRAALVGLEAYRGDVRRVVGVLVGCPVRASPGFEGVDHVGRSGACRRPNRALTHDGDGTNAHVAGRTDTVSRPQEVRIVDTPRSQ